MQRPPKPTTPESADVPLTGEKKDPSAPDVRASRRLTTIDPMYRMDLDSDSESSSSDDEESNAPKEVLEPMVVVKGFMSQI